MALVLLAILIAAWFGFQYGGRAIAIGIRRRLFAPGPWQRWRWWLLRMWGLFGLSALVTILALGIGDPLTGARGEFEATAIVARAWVDDIGGIDAIAGPMAIGFAIGLAIIVVYDRWRRYRNKGVADWRASIEPATIDQLIPATCAAATAAIVEELYFRLALPLAATQAFGNVWFALALSAAMFAWLHRYQGWRGATLATLTGMLLAVVYLGTGRLWIAIAIHAAIDLNAIVLRPLLAGRVAFSSSTDSPS